MTRFAVLVFSPERERGDSLGRRIEALGARLQSVASDAAELRDGVLGSRPDALVADLGPSPDVALAALEALPEPRPALLVCGPTDDNHVVLRAMRLGAREFLVPEPDASALQAALERVLRKAAPSPGAPTQAPVIALLGAKGGVGTTFVACQLTVTLQALGGRTALFDLAAPPGDAALHLDLQPSYGLAGAARETEALDATFLRTLLCSHPSGAQMLAATQRAEDAELLRAASVERAIALLRADFDWVVIDLGRGWSEGSVRALDFASQVLLLTQADVPALANARSQLDLLERLGVAPERVHVVENRHGRAEAIPERDATRFLGRPIEVRLPDDPAAAASANEGRMLGETAAYGHLHRAVVGLARSAASWCGREERRPASKGLLERVRLGLWRKSYGAA